MILLLGFPKSGTTSFQNLFNQLGYNSIHWKYKDVYIGSIIKKNKTEHRILLEGLLDVDCITQLDVCLNHHDNYWPQIIDYQQLYRENKDATFILNKRDPQKILDSFKHWGYQKDVYPSCYLDRLGARHGASSYLVKLPRSVQLAYSI